jgi:hypothetical protein
VVKVAEMAQWSEKSNIGTDGRQLVHLSCETFKLSLDML